jgi:hypothetical protein
LGAGGDKNDQPEEVERHVAGSPEPVERQAKAAFCKGATINTTSQARSPKKAL